MNEILSLDNITHDEVVGIVLIMKAKMEMVSHMRSYLAFFDTLRGRTIISCATTQDEFDGFRNDYEHITKGVTFPR
jgi:hypothetical protein